MISILSAVQMPTPRMLLTDTTYNVQCRWLKQRSGHNNNQRGKRLQATTSIVRQFYETTEAGKAYLLLAGFIGKLED